MVRRILHVGANVNSVGRYGSFTVVSHLTRGVNGSSPGQNENFYYAIGLIFGF